jgi:hypothetical protein
MDEGRYYVLVSVKSHLGGGMWKLEICVGYCTAGWSFSVNNPVSNRFPPRRKWKLPRNWLPYPF